jgi:hypothetical protein
MPARFGAGVGRGGITAGAVTARTSIRPIETRMTGRVSSGRARSLRTGSGKGTTGATPGAGRLPRRPIRGSAAAVELRAGDTGGRSRGSSLRELTVILSATPPGSQEARSNEPGSDGKTAGNAAGRSGGSPDRGVAHAGLDGSMLRAGRLMGGMAGIAWGSAAASPDSTSPNVRLGSTVAPAANRGGTTGSGTADDPVDRSTRRDRKSVMSSPARGMRAAGPR